GVAGRQPAVHQALCLVRGPALPGCSDSGGSTGTAAGLARGQGTGETLPAGTAAASREARPTGDWEREGIGQERATLPDCGERLGATACDLVRGQRSLGSQYGFVLPGVGTYKEPPDSLGGHGHVEAVPHFHPQAYPCAADSHPVRQIPCLAPLERGVG